MTTYRIVHTTRYAFDEVTASCEFEARLRARDLPGQVCRFHQLVVRPLTGKRHERHDDFGNSICGFTVPAALQTLEVSAINVVDRTPPPAPDLDASPPWDSMPSGTEELDTFLMTTPLTAGTAELAAFAQSSFPAGRPVLRGVRDLTRRIHRDFAYVPGATTVATTAAEAARLGRGVCQDFAQVAIACLRTRGLPARYVSGYLDTSAQRRPNAPPVGDASHAWFAVHAPGIGWVDFDPTNDCLARDGYVTLAWGGDYSDAAPLRGATAGGGRHALEVSVEMARDAAA